MAMRTPDQVAENWARGMQGAGERIRQGVAAVTVAPTEKAIQAIPRMVEGVQRAAADGSIERGLRRVTLEDWRRQMTEVGIGRVGTGAQAAKPKFREFMGELLPYIDSNLGQLNSSMPRGDLSQNIARMNAWVEKMAQFKRQRS